MLSVCRHAADHVQLNIGQQESKYFEKEERVNEQEPASQKTIFFYPIQCVKYFLPVLLSHPPRFLKQNNTKPWTILKSYTF